MFLDLRMLSDERIDPVLDLSAEAVEEAIVAPAPPHQSSLSKNSLSPLRTLPSLPVMVSAW